MDFDKLLQAMIAKNGSDLFITEGVPPSMKINGEIVPMSKHNLSAEQTRALVLSVMSDAQKKNLMRLTSANLPYPTVPKKHAFVCRHLYKETVLA